MNFLILSGRGCLYILEMNSLCSCFIFLISFCIQVLLKLISPLFLEKAMAPHSSTLAWKIPWKEEPCGLQSMGLLRVGHD